MAEQQNGWRVAAPWLICVIAAFLLFVWPTPYVYRTDKFGLIRINRITQSVSHETEDGWMTKEEMAERSQRRREAKRFTAEERAQLHMAPAIADRYGWRYKMTNNAARAVREMQVAVVVETRSGQRERYAQTIPDSVMCQPDSTTEETIRFITLPSPEAVRHWRVEVIDAWE